MPVAYGKMTRWFDLPLPKQLCWTWFSFEQYVETSRCSGCQLEYDTQVMHWNRWLNEYAHSDRIRVTLRDEAFVFEICLKMTRRA